MRRPRKTTIPETGGGHDMIDINIGLWLFPWWCHHHHHCG
jgi:hypothetical protein